MQSSFSRPLWPRWARQPGQRIYLAIALSLLLHAAWPAYEQLARYLGPRPLPAPAARPAQLLAQLRQPPPAEPLLKDTLTREAEPSPKRAAPAPPAKSPASPVKQAKKPEAVRQAAQRKLNSHVFYPEEAVDQGLEGVVRLLIVLDPTGKIVSVSVASSSGHAILDRAAVKAAYAVGSLPDTGLNELILPVTFRLD